MLPVIARLMSIATLAAASLFLVNLPSQAAEASVVSVPHNDDLYHVKQGKASKLTYAQWAALGWPEPTPAEGEFVRYAWSSDIYARVAVGDALMVEHLSYEGWLRAGSPTATTTGWVEGSTTHLWGTSTEVFLTEPSGHLHKLTFAEFEAAGSPKSERRSDQGWVKYAWDDTIVRMTSLSSGQGSRATYAEWRAAGFPTPRVVTRVTGDQVTRDFRSDTLWYSGPGLHRALTLSDWRAMGYPSPTITGCTSSYRMIQPTGTNGSPTTPFGWRVHPITKRAQFHTGIDLGDKAGEPIYAAASGTVSRAAYSSSGGNEVTIDHSQFGNVSSRYLHMTRYVVKTGQKVAACDVIGYVGSTGSSNKPHLHFTVRSNGETVDPVAWVGPISGYWE